MWARTSTAAAGRLAVETARVGCVTSESHPITVSWVLGPEDASAAGIQGRLGLCYCPGKKVVRSGVRHDRSLQADLGVLRQQFQVTAIVCLLNDAELRSYQLRSYAHDITAAGFVLLQHPIIEMAPPEDVTSTDAAVQAIADMLRAGHVVAMHCRGGVGRAGLMAACLLLRLGVVANSAAAIQWVRQRRCRTAVETVRQENWVHGYAARLAALAAAAPTPAADSCKAIWCYEI